MTKSSKMHVFFSSLVVVLAAGVAAQNNSPPGGTIPNPEQSSPLPGGTVPNPKQSSPLPGNTGQNTGQPMNQYAPGPVMPSAERDVVFILDIVGKPVKPEPLNPAAAAQPVSPGPNQAPFSSSSSAPPADVQSPLPEQPLGGDPGFPAAGATPTAPPGAGPSPPSGQASPQGSPPAGPGLSPGVSPGASPFPEQGGGAQPLQRRQDLASGPQGGGAENVGATEGYPAPQNIPDPKGPVYASPLPRSSRGAAAGPSPSPAVQGNAGPLLPVDSAGSFQVQPVEQQTPGLQQGPRGKAELLLEDKNQQSSLLIGVHKSVGPQPPNPASPGPILLTITDLGSLDPAYAVSGSVIDHRLNTNVGVSAQPNTQIFDPKSGKGILVEVFKTAATLPPEQNDGFTFIGNLAEALTGYKIPPKLQAELKEIEPEVRKYLSMAQAPVRIRYEIAPADDAMQGSGYVSMFDITADGQVTPSKAQGASGGQVAAGGQQSTYQESTSINTQGGGAAAQAGASGNGGQEDSLTGGEPGGYQAGRGPSGANPYGGNPAGVYPGSGAGAFGAGTGNQGTQNGGATGAQAEGVVAGGSQSYPGVGTGTGGAGTGGAGTGGAGTGGAETGGAGTGGAETGGLETGGAGTGGAGTGGAETGGAGTGGLETGGAGTGGAATGSQSVQTGATGGQPPQYGAGDSQAFPDYNTGAGGAGPQSQASGVTGEQQYPSQGGSQVPSAKVRRVARSLRV
ncbi:MAG: hypothetical protein M1833_005200 [Piccolia ochrophora]|nr:MAG: hypothetical protein M1833_005200 [Piccolia ochrophora]